MRSALSGLPYDTTTGRFAAVERLSKLVERPAPSASPAERAGNYLDSRLVAACVGSLYLGWVSGESWLRPVWGLDEMDDDEVTAGLERVILGILKAPVPSVVTDVSSGPVRPRPLIRLPAIPQELAALRELLRCPAIRPRGTRRDVLCPH